jgi:iron complex transport system permease protein
MNNLLQKRYAGHIRRKLLTAFLLAGALVFLGLSGISVGGATYSIKESWNAVITGFGKPIEEMELRHQILWRLRIPRVLTSLTAGVGLAVAGLVMQVILRNPLASPYTLGISSAASFGAALAIVLKTGVSDILPFTVPYDYLISANAFCFTFLSTFIIYWLSKTQKVTAETVVLFGVAVSYTFSAGLSFLQYLGKSEELAALTYWTFGSLSKANWFRLKLCSGAVLLTLIVLYRKAWDFSPLASPYTLGSSAGAA